MNTAIRQIFPRPDGWILPFLLVCLTGCMSPWPALDPKASDWTWYLPKPLSSPELAVSTLKNLQTQFAPISGLPPRHTTSIEIDPFSMRVKWQWTENDTMATTAPTSSGGLVGLSYVSFYGEATQYTTTQSQNEKMVAVPFTQVDGFSTYRLQQPNPAKPREQISVWLLMISEDDHPEMVEILVVPDQATAEKLADAIATLAIAQGRKVDGRRSFGARGEPINPWQQNALGPDAVRGGVLVLEVAKDSQADRNGLRPMDVVTFINNNPTPDIATAIKAFRLEPAKPKVTYLRREWIADAKGKYKEQAVERTAIFDK